MKLIETQKAIDALTNAGFALDADHDVFRRDNQLVELVATSGRVGYSRPTKLAVVMHEDTFPNGILLASTENGVDVLANRLDDVTQNGPYADVLHEAGFIRKGLGFNRGDDVIFLSPRSLGHTPVRGVEIHLHHNDLHVWEYMEAGQLSVWLSMYGKDNSPDYTQPEDIRPISEHDGYILSAHTQAIIEAMAMEA